jgi:hypothetical protein
MTQLVFSFCSTLPPIYEYGRCKDGVQTLWKKRWKWMNEILFVTYYFRYSEPVNELNLPLNKKPRNGV